MSIPDPLTDPQFYDGVPMRRLFAFVIDSVIITGIWFLVIFLGFLFAFMTAGLGAPLAMLLFSLSGFVYRWLLVAQRSATLGMMVTGIEIRDVFGRRLTHGTGFFHTFAYYVTTLFLPLAIIGWILMASSPHRRTLHDTITGSVVINRPA